MVEMGNLIKVEKRLKTAPKSIEIPSWIFSNFARTINIPNMSISQTTYIRDYRKSASKSNDSIIFGS